MNLQTNFNEFTQQIKLNCSVNQFTFLGKYGAQNEAYMSRSGEKWVRGLCINELGVSG